MGNPWLITMENLTPPFLSTSRSPSGRRSPLASKRKILQTSSGSLPWGPGLLGAPFGEHIWAMVKMPKSFRDHDPPVSQKMWDPWGYFFGIPRPECPTQLDQLLHQHHGLAWNGPQWDGVDSGLSPKQISQKKSAKPVHWKTSTEEF